MTSATRRDFPTPASPSTVKSWHERSASARSKASSSSRRSRSRPTIGARSRCGRPRARGATESSRKASSAACLPLTVNGGTGSACTA